MIKAIVGYMTFVLVTVTLGYWYHISSNRIVGLGCSLGVVCLLCLAASWVYGEGIWTYDEKEEKSKREF